MEGNEVNLSIGQMVYAKVELGKEVDWRTIKIQPKSLMIAPIEQFIPLGKKFPRDSFDKKMLKEEIDNTRIVWFDTLSDDEPIGCDLLMRPQIEATIKEKMQKNTLNVMVDNESLDVSYFLPAIEGMEFGYEGDNSGPTMDEGKHRSPYDSEHGSPFDSLPMNHIVGGRVGCIKSSFARI